MDQKREAEIIEKVLSGDRQAFALLVDEYKVPIYNLAYRMSGNIEDAEDLTQETFISAYKYLWRFDLKKKLFTWLYTISLNIIRNYLKKNKVKNSTNDIDLNSATGKENPSPEETLIRTDNVHLINSCLLRLKYDERMLLIMRYQQELSFEDIAEITGKKVSSIKMNIYRGSEKLEKMIGNYKGELC
jgi:RNA polymerase sigma-70 factor (ECF subfamily)